MSPTELTARVAKDRARRAQCLGTPRDRADPLGMVAQMVAALDELSTTIRGAKSSRASAVEVIGAGGAAMAAVGKVYLFAISQTPVDLACELFPGTCSLLRVFAPEWRKLDDQALWRSRVFPPGTLLYSWMDMEAMLLHAEAELRVLRETQPEGNAQRLELQQTLEDASEAFVEGEARLERALYLEGEESWNFHLLPEDRDRFRAWVTPNYRGVWWLNSREAFERS